MGLTSVDAGSTVGQVQAVPALAPYVSQPQPAPLTFTASIAASDPTHLTGVSNINGLVVGQGVFGPGIPGGSTITAIGTTVVTISQNIIVGSAYTGVTVTVTYGFTATVTNGNYKLTSVSGFDGLSAGQGLLGVGIPSTAVITNLDAAGHTVTMSQKATANASGAVVQVAGNAGVPGALASEQNSASISFRTDEAARYVTVGGAYAAGTQIRFSTTKIGRGSADAALEVASSGNVLMGNGAVNAGDSGVDLVQVRGAAGTNEVQTIQGSAAGPFYLVVFGALPVGGIPEAWVTGSLSATATASAVQAAIGSALDAALGLSPGTAAAELVVSGGPLPAAITVTFGGVLGSTHLNSRYWLPMGTVQPATGVSTLSVSESVTGVPSDAAERLLLLRRGAATSTADYIAVQTASGSAVMTVTSGGNLALGSSAPSIVGGSGTSPGAIGFSGDGTTAAIGFTHKKVGFFSKAPQPQTSAYILGYSSTSRSLTTQGSTALSGIGNGAFGYDSYAHANQIITQVNNLVTDMANVKSVLNSIIADMQTYGLFQ